MRVLHWAGFLAAVAVVLAILVFPACAQQLQQPTYKILPPPQYDHEYEGDLTIQIVDTLEELYALCRITNVRYLACSTHNSASCLIVMVKDEIMRQRGYTTGLLFRHEQGHCNGWPADHPGQQTLPPLGPLHWAPPEWRVKLPMTPQVVPVAKDQSRLLP